MARVDAGENGIRRIRQFDPSGFACQIAGEVPPFKIAEFIPPFYRKAAKLMIRDTHLAAIAAHHAFATARLGVRDDDGPNADGHPLLNCHVGAGLISIDLDELAAAMLDSQREGVLDLSLWGRRRNGTDDAPLAPQIPAEHVGEPPHDYLWRDRRVEYDHSR